MITIPIGDIIRESFKLAWRHKYLWLFGLFVSTGFSGNIPGGENRTNLDAMREWVLAALAVIILVALAVFIVYMIIHVISKSALIYNVYQIETNGVHGIGAGWDFGLKRFWPMLGVTLLQGMVVFAFLIVIAGVEVILFYASLVLGFVSLLFAVPVFFLGLAMIIVIWHYAERFVALETCGVIRSIGEGWSLLIQQWKPSVLTLLVKIGIAIAVAVGVMGIGALLILPAVALWVISQPLAVVYGVLVLLPFAVVVGSYFGTFDSAVWTKVFLHLRAPAYAGTAPDNVQPGDTPDSMEPPASSPPLFE